MSGRYAVAPVVRYFVADSEPPQLLAEVCDGCGARYLERRNGCGRCGATSFTRHPVVGSGTISAYTVVWRDAPGIETPFVSCIVDVGDGLAVKSNLVGIDPAAVDPAVLGEPVDLVVTDLGVDADGTMARSFVFALRAYHTRGARG
jgi:uncharacterized OB-fold protein